MKRPAAFFLMLFLLLSLPFAANAAASDILLEQEVQILANAVYLVNEDTGRVIYQKNADQRIYPASTTKIMSAALALELADNPETTVVTLPDDLWAEFEGIDISNAGLAGGEELSLYDLIHCMLLQSANEAASAVAAYFGKEDFFAAMNAKAKSLGCTGTHFSNAHGLFSDDHYTTAEDLYKITAWALSVPGFREIANKARYTLPATNKNDEKTLATTILMQDPNSGYYTSYIQGVKTGTIPESGRCLVSAAEQDGMRYVLVLMGCPVENTAVFWSDGRSMFNETRTVYDWLFDNLRLENAVNPDTAVTEIPLRYAKRKDSLVLYPVGELFAVIDSRSAQSAEIRYEIDIPEFIEAPVGAMQQIGTARVFADGILLGEVGLVSREQAEYSWFVMVMDKITDILQSDAAYIIYAVLFAAVAFYLYYLFVIVRRQRRKNRPGHKKRPPSKSGGRRR